MTVWNLRVGTDSDVGRQRPRNEDSFCVLLPGEDLPAGISAVVAVADGMGGHDAGDVASAFVVDAIRSAFALGGDLRAPERDLAGQLAAMLRKTNVKLHAVAVEQASARGMGSTITMAVLRGDDLVVAHVGDSRLYRLRDGHLEQITEDHSWTAEQRRRGFISEEEEAHHPRRNLLTDCIGVDREISVFTTVLGLQDGDRFLLCSDGLFGPVSDGEIAETLNTPDPETAASLLVERANEAGGPDNITAVVLDVPRAGPLSGDEPGTGAVHWAEENRIAGATSPASRIAEGAPLTAPSGDPGDSPSRTEESVKSRRFVPRWTLTVGVVALILIGVWGWNRSAQETEQVIGVRAPGSAPIESDGSVGADQNVQNDQPGSLPSRADPDDRDANREMLGASPPVLPDSADTIRADHRPPHQDP